MSASSRATRSSRWVCLKSCGCERPDIQDTPAHSGRTGVHRLCRWIAGRPAAVFLRMGRNGQEHSVRRTVHVRACPLHADTRRLLGRRPSVMGAWLSARRAEPDEDHGRDFAARRARRRHERRDARRSGTLPLPHRLHHRGRLVVAHGRRSRQSARLSAEGRLPDRRRLQAGELARRARRRMGAVCGRRCDGCCPA